MGDLRKRNILTMSELEMFFQTTFNAINRDFYNNDLEKVVITVKQGRKPSVLGSFCTYKEWVQGDKLRHEISISANYVGNRTIEEIVTTLMHEMAHLYNQQHGIKDTTRSGTYHNKEFKRTAENHGLDISYDQKIGWSITEAKQTTKDWISQNIRINKIKIYMLSDDDLGRTGTAHGNGRKPKAKQSYRKYVCPCCGLIVRATKDCNIACLDCDEQMEIES